MPTKIKDVRPPSGAMRVLYRLPIWLFHWHLGWLAMDRFLLLTHIGRKSGLPRQVVLEVVQHDKTNDTYYVLAGWGEQADWVKNIEKTPIVTIDVGRRQLRVLAKCLSAEEAETKVMDYAQRNPRLIRVLPRMMGYRIDGTETDIRALARLSRVFSFEPIQ